MIDTDQYKNPFVGLRSFEEHEDYLFFGRKTEINDLLKKFNHSRFLAVVGSSGSGKSSLVKSGLLPALHSGFHSVGRSWRVAIIRPGSDPIGNLAKKLSEEGILYTSIPEDIHYKPIIESTLRRSSDGLRQSYKQAHLPETENLLIVVDQFEELFRFRKSEEDNNSGVSDALNFINLLLNASTQADYQIYVLITMRSDFLGDCVQFRGLPEAINEGQYLVPRMTREEIKEAITGPIAVGGATITQTLVTRVLNDVSSDFDQLPVLQHAMMRTWEAWRARKQFDTPINLDDYLKIGGMSESLSQHANEAYREIINEHQQKHCELIFKALTDKSMDGRGIRRPRKVSALSTLIQSHPAEVIEIVEHFRQTGRTFLMPPPQEKLTEDSIIDISHESLMRIWDKLKVWTEEEVQDSDLFRRLADSADREAQDLESLWVDPELAQGLELRSRFNNNEAMIKVWAEPFQKDTNQALDFLKRSEKNAEQVRLREEQEARAKVEQEKKDQRRKWERLMWLAGFAILALIAYGSYQTVVNTIKEEKLVQLRDSISAIQEGVNPNPGSGSGPGVIQAPNPIGQESIDTIIIRDTILTHETILAPPPTIVNKVISQGDAVDYYQNQLRNFQVHTAQDQKMPQDRAFELEAICYHLQHLDNKGVSGAGLTEHEVYDHLYAGLNALGQNQQVLRMASVAEKQTTTVCGKPECASEGILLAKACDENDLMAFTTKDQRVHICKSGTNKELKNSPISVGGLITALTFSNDGKLYYALASGEIGYIGLNDLATPVLFNNDLGSKINSLQFFSQNSKNYLLASSILGKVTLLELSKNTKQKADGQVLPSVECPKYLGVIKEAQYQQEAKQVYLSTTKGNFLWDPFASSLLTKLHNVLMAKDSTQMKEVRNAFKKY